MCIQAVRVVAASPQADQRIDGKSFGAEAHCKLRDGLVTREVRVEIILRCQMAVEGRKCRDDEIGGYAVCPFGARPTGPCLQPLEHQIRESSFLRALSKGDIVSDAPEAPEPVGADEIGNEFRGLIVEPVIPLGLDQSRAFGIKLEGGRYT